MKLTGHVLHDSFRWCLLSWPSTSGEHVHIKCHMGTTGHPEQ